MARSGGRHLLVLLHGYGSSEQELFDRASPTVDTSVVLASIRGPAVEDAGFAWMSLQDSLTASNAEAIAAVARASARPVLDWLAILPPVKSVGLLGVSQGAVLALQLLRMAPGRFSYAINLSGYVLAGQEAGDDLLRQKRPPVFWGRGRSDPVIPASYIDRTQQWLPLHSTLTSKVYPGGHEELPVTFADAGAFVTRLTD